LENVQLIFELSDQIFRPRYTVADAGTVSCAGTLVSNQHIVAAASCLHEGMNGVRPDRLNVYLGPYSLTDLIPVKVRNYCVHHDFTNDANYDRTGADMAFSTLDGELPRNVNPICIASDEKNTSYSKITLRAIGRTSDGVNVAMDPIGVKMNMISEQDFFTRKAWEF